MEFMDKDTFQALDFQTILNKIETKSPYGRIYKSKIKPYRPGDEDRLREELDLVDLFVQYCKKGIYEEFENILIRIKDIRNSIKAGREGRRLNTVELFQIKNFLFQIRELYSLLKRQGINLKDDMEISPIPELENLLDPEDTRIPTFYIYDTYSLKLKTLRDKKRQIEREIKNKKNLLKDKVQEELNIKINLKGDIQVPKDDGDLYKRISKNDNLIYISESYLYYKFSLKDTKEIQDLNHEYNVLSLKGEEEEGRILDFLSKEIGKSYKDLMKNISSSGKIDFILAKAKYGLEIGGIRPEISYTKTIRLEDGVHPIVKDILKKENLEYKPISIGLKEGVSLVTGPNMGGKTLSLKLIGLLTAMGQYGLLLPAKSFTFSLNNFIRTSIGDRQSPDEGLSTFAGEIKTISQAIDLANKNGLILIDELARGTNPQEGYGIAKAIIDYLKDKKSITLITSHYDNLVGDNIDHFQVVGLSNIDLGEEIKLDNINKHMDYRLKKVDKDTMVPREALNIASLMGMDKEILLKAEEIINKGW